MPSQVLVKHDIARPLELVRLGLVLVVTLPPPLGEPLFHWRAVEAMLVGIAAASTERVRIPARPIDEQRPAEVEFAHALPRRELSRPLVGAEETDPDPVVAFDAGVLAA
jgi:hypothetical protein